MKPVTYGLRRVGTTEIIGVIPDKIHAMPPKNETWMAEYEEVPLYDQATVDHLCAELRKWQAWGEAETAHYPTGDERR